MKRIINISGAVVIAALLGACVKDNGNYTYKKGNDVKVSYLTSQYNVFLGDTVKIDAARVYSNPNDTSDYDHAWYVDGVKASDQRVLTFSANTVGLRYVTYYMIDRKSGISYTPASPLFVILGSPFQTGWGILYEQNGKSELGHVRVANNVYFDYKDLYKTNNGEELGSGPIKIRDYPVSGGRGQYVIQRGGQGCVELDAQTMKKKLLTSQSFAGGLPAGFAPTDMAFYQTAADLLVDSNGNVYPGYTNGTLAFTASFLSTPLTIKGGLKVGDIWDSWSKISGFALMYDKLNKRVMRAKVPVLVTGTGLVVDTLVAPITAFPANYTPPGNLGTWEYVWGGTFNDVSPSMDGAMLLKNPADQSLYYETFKYAITNPEVLTPGTRILFPGNSVATPASKYVAIKSRNYLFFTGGSNNEKLYYYDAQSGSIVKLYATMSAKINVITSSDDSQQLAVGLDDGTFVLYDISNATIVAGTPTELHRYSGLGRVVDIVVKGGSMN